MLTFIHFTFAQKWFDNLIDHKADKDIKDIFILFPSYNSNEIDNELYKTYYSFRNLSFQNT